MRWNFDYDLCAILFTGALIVYFIYRRWLPIFSNRLFLLLMEASVAVAVTDIIASIICEQGMKVPVSAIYVSNMIYYVVLIFKPMVFCYYCFALAQLPVRRFNYVGSLLLPIPFLISTIYVLATPWINGIFYVTEDHVFQYGPWRPVLFVVTLIYLLVGLVAVYCCKCRVRKIIRYSLGLYVVLTIIGHIYQVYFNPYTQTVSLSSTMGILIMFLIYQNPDYDRERKTGMFREFGIKKLIDEDYLYGVQRATAEVAFENYSEIRSVYGEEIAATIIRSMARFLRESFSGRDQFYVHNGRFVMIFYGGPDILREYRKIIMERCRKPFYYENGSIYLSPVFAFTLGDIPIEDQLMLRDCFKIAIERSLSKGKGSAIRLTKAMHDQILHNRKVEKALMKALKEDRLQVYYQPIFSTGENRVTAAEALVRIVDDELGILYPDEFIWKAEENGSILTLGEQVFRKVCLFVQNHDMEAMGLDFIEVNLSPLQCMREKLAVEFERIMNEYQVDPKYIGLEITETASSNIEVIKNNMNHLVDVGVKLALDDYGTGYSNLINILSLPLSIVKIDKSIVWAYFNDGNNFLLRVIQTFEDKDLRLVVEGVETREMADTLAKLGCQFEQGYYYSKPIPEEDFIAYLTEKHWVK